MTADRRANRSEVTVQSERRGTRVYTGRKWPNTDKPVYEEDYLSTRLIGILKQDIFLIGPQVWQAEIEGSTQE